MPAVRDNFGSIPVRGTGKLDKMTLEELTWWQAVADGMTLRFDMRAEDQSFHAICVDCGQSVMRLTSNGLFIFFNISTLTAQLVAHLRNVHRELGNARTEVARNADLGGSVDGDTDTPDRLQAEE